VRGERDQPTPSHRLPLTFRGPEMLHVALTGNVASGKSTVAALFRDWGATVFDADATVRTLQQPGTPVFDAIVARFGAGVLSEDGQLDRDALRTRILANPTERQALEEIVHPAVRTERRRLLEQQDRPADAILVSDIPLLFEAADPADFDAVVLVDAPESLRVERLVQQRGLARSEAEALVRLQLPAAEKRLRADLVIENEQSRDVLRERAWEVWRKLRSLARNRA
jgi:dephospho-CoA kinase